MSSESARVLVVGAGGIGGIVAGCLAEVGTDVTAVSTNAAIRDAIASRGFRMRDEGEERAVPGAVVEAPDPAARYDVIILATQPPQVEAAARAALPVLADDGRMDVLQNGLCEERIAAIIGAERVVGAIVAWGASMPEPGLYDRTAAGGFTIGRLGGAPDDACRRIGGLLEAVGPVTYTDNLAGARWSKLALNCAISSIGTIAGERLGPLVRSRRIRRLALEIMTEVVQVARTRGVKLEKVSGTLDLEWIALTPAERRSRGSPGLFAKHSMLLAVGARYRRMRSSMLAAIERGRPPAIDFLNGEIATRGQAAGVATPINARIVQTVWAIARGEVASSRALLDQIFDETR